MDTKAANARNRNETVQRRIGEQAERCHRAQHSSEVEITHSSPHLQRQEDVECLLRCYAHPCTHATRQCNLPSHVCD